MTTVKIDIINPKAKKLLNDLAALNLIVIRDTSSGLDKVLKRLRKNADKAPSLEEITKEVELVRSKRYGK